MTLRRAVGLVYTPGVEELLTSRGLVDVVEIEPEMFWWQDAGTLELCRGAWSVVRDLPLPKIVHGVGHAVGGSVAPTPDQLRLLRRCVDELGAPWASHHLAFNWYDSKATRTCAGFFLPPQQSAEGVRLAARSIRTLASALGCELAVETGVSYLRPRDDELADGEFVARVCEAADCSVLLDLHNLWANERNGRQSIDAFLAALPLDRVIEVHVAGGFELDGFWLDAHSGAPPAPLLDVLDEVLPLLPAVRAVCFEILAPFVPRTGLDTISSVLERIRRAWERPRRRTLPAPARHEVAAAKYSAREWEQTVGDLVIGRPADGELARELATDPGIALLRTLIGQARAGMITGALPATMRMLLTALGPDAIVALLQRYWQDALPQLAASAESEAFAAWLAENGPALPLLADTVAFDLASGRAEASGEPVAIELSIDPRVLCEALANGRLPEPGPARVIATVTPTRER